MTKRMTLFSLFVISMIPLSGYAAYGGGGGMGGGLGGPSPSSTHPITSPPVLGGPTGAAPSARPMPPMGRRPPPPPGTVQAIFTSPGIVTLQGSAWVGTENLYNLTPDLGLFVELVYPSGMNLGLREANIEERVIPVFRDSGFAIRGNRLMAGTPLPFLHCFLMIHPIDRGFVAYCAIRLFEEAKFSRVFLKQGIVWQTITWETQELIVASTEQIVEEVLKTFQNLANNFTQRYKQELQGRSNVTPSYGQTPSAPPGHPSMPHR